MRSIELFAGCGGLALGTHQAGFETLVAAERGRWCCATLRANRGGTLPSGMEAVEGDVRDIDWGRFADRVDLVSGGPPCRPFSAGGLGGAQADPRDMFPALTEVVRQVRPRAFLVENVQGLARSRFADYFSHVLARLARPESRERPGEGWRAHLARLRDEPADPGLAYDVSWAVLEAADYGVPQMRSRVIIVGFRSDPGVEWRFPEPTHLAPEVAQTRGAPAWRTAGEAIADLPEPGPTRSPGWADHVLQPGARAYPGHTGSRLDRPAKTLKAGVHGVPGGENTLRLPDGSVRYLTVREAARLQTFPDEHRLDGPWSHAMRQLGNAAPVLLARVVATSVREALESAADARPARGSDQPGRRSW